MRAGFKRLHGAAKEPRPVTWLDAQVGGEHAAWQHRLQAPARIRKAVGGGT